MQIGKMVAAEFIEKNIDTFKAMIKIGAVSPSYLNYYRIYCFYKSTKSLKSKMERYNFTADSMKTATNTVINAVKVMEGRV